MMGSSHCQSRTALQKANSIRIKSPLILWGSAGFLSEDVIQSGQAAAVEHIRLGDDGVKGSEELL